MTRLTSKFTRWLSSAVSVEQGIGGSFGDLSPLPTQDDPPIHRVARPARAVLPHTPTGFVAEILEAAPYRTVPVVAEGILVGLATEAALVDAFLHGDRPRDTLRETPIADLMEPPLAYLTPYLSSSQAAERFHELHTDVLPVVEPHPDGQLVYLGMLSRADLLQEFALARSYRPPMVGGMATPIGVHLTNGNFAGGAGNKALILSGFVMAAIHLLGFALQQWVNQSILPPSSDWMTHHFPTFPLSGSLQQVVLNIAGNALQIVTFLFLLHWLPLTGYHAAEHQVVHALEQSEPLVIESVRRMPRVHPRCGTNLIAVGLLVSVGYLLQPLLRSFALPVGVLLAFTYWRPFGSWLQQNVTTRPASDKQLRAGIGAAKELLRRHNRAPFAPVRPLRRLWHSGLVQIMLGFAILYGLLALLAAVAPPVRTFVQPYLREMNPADTRS